MRLTFLSVVFVLSQACGRGHPPDASAARKADAARDSALRGVQARGGPWWFWENYKARWLRDAIGDGPTAFLHLLLSAILVWVGLFTNWTFGRR